MDDAQIAADKVAKLPNGNYLTVDQVRQATLDQVKKVIEAEEPFVNLTRDLAERKAIERNLKQYQSKILTALTKLEEGI